MQYEESELGLRASSGVIEQGSTSEEPAAAENSPRGRKSNKYARESMPPTWSSTLDSSMTGNKLTIGMDSHDGSPSRTPSAESTPRAGTSGHGDVDLGVKRAGLGQSGTEKEVRRDGQYVHFRR
jgi:hypothetical protein